jgi:thioesterase domain-containing protein
VGRYDNFFELGGHSLLVLLVLSKCRQLDITISVIEFLTHPTIESLASYIRSRNPSLLQDSVAILLRTGAAEPPLFLVHDGSGEVLYGQKLVPHLAPGFPVYGLAAPGFFEEPLRTIQAMATRMVRMIRAVETDGPYRIAGWSFGATLAYEIATQLIGDDASVEFLGSLDGYYLGPGAKKPMETPLDDISLLLNIHQGDAERFQRLKALADENSSFEALMQAGQERSLINVELSVDEMRRFLNRLRSNVLAARSYIAYSLPIPLHLFAAEDAEFTGAVHSLRNWEMALPMEQIRSISVPGDHLSMMEPDNIVLLGNALSQALRQARETRAP